MAFQSHLAALKLYSLIFPKYSSLSLMLYSVGTTGKIVIAFGDSLGGNLCTGLALQCAQYSLSAPSHLFCVCPSLLCRPYPSPSRILALLDPLAMFPYLLRCLNVFADSDYVNSLPRTMQQGMQLIKLLNCGRYCSKAGRSSSCSLRCSRVVKIIPNFSSSISLYLNIPYCICCC